MVNAEIYKADPNENLFRQSRAMSPNPNEMPWPDPAEKDVVYLAWSNYTKGYAAGWAAAKAEASNGTLHSLWLLIGIAVSAGVAVLFMKKEY
jgi:hypothetical protein